MLRLLVHQRCDLHNQIVRNCKYNNSFLTSFMIRPERKNFSEAVQAPKYNININYYARLGLQACAQDTEIKEKFYKLAKKYHPDSRQSQGISQDKHVEE